SLILQGFALSQTASRGGTLALMIAAVFMLSVLWLRKMGIKTFLIFSVSLCLGMALFCLLFFPVLFAKFQTLTQTDLAVYFRLSRWQDTWNMFRDFSWFGIGVGGFQELYPLYKSIPEKPIFDQFRFFYAENEYIQALAELGIVGCGILSALVIVLARSVVRMWLRVQSKTLFWISLGLASGAAGMLAHSFFDFPMHIPSNMALFSVFGGVLWRMSRSYAAMPSGIKEEREEVLAPSRASWARRRIFGSGVFVLIVLWIALPFLWRQWITEHYYLKAKKKLDAMSIHNQVHLPELEASQGFLEQAVRWDSRQARIQYEFARLYLFRSNLVAGASSSLPSSGGEDGLRLAEQFLLGAIQRFPLDGEYFCLLGQLYERQNKKESARTYYERAIYLEPQNAYYKFNLARNRLSAGDLLFSRELCRQILEYNPSYIAAIFEFIPQYPGWITEKNWLELIPDGENHWLVAKRLMDYLDEKGNSSLAALIQTTMNQWQIQP
ncbi:MAG: O-antigen ligase family protein, partial [Candidatus Omnitrophica bacterium]|nr:O-antigen ligase family protein [Candidatus Omnitrophota bacterium]